MSHSLLMAGVVPRRAASYPWYGYAGLAGMAVSQVLMFAQIPPFPNWFTPLQWTGYLLVLDAALVKLRGESFIRDHTREFLAMLVLSNVFWFMFEGYNLHLRNWAYVNLPGNLFVRLCGYFWAFATIYPGVLMTSAVVDELGWFRGAVWGRQSGDAATRQPLFTIPAWVHRLLIATGVIFCTGPLLVPAAVAQYLFALVWVGFFLLLDPVNHRLGLPSLLAELERGSVQKLLSLFAAGLICGVLWEFWNYWAATKWIYTVPYLNRPKLFEMPLYGYLGFLAFAVECHVMWHFARHFLPKSWKS